MISSLPFFVQTWTPLSITSLSTGTRCSSVKRLRGSFSFHPAHSVWSRAATSSGRQSLDLPLCRLRRGEGRRLAAEAPALPSAVVAEMVVERVNIASLLAEVVREIGVAPPVARGALGVRVLPVSVRYFVGCRFVEGVGRDSNREP